MSGRRANTACDTDRLASPKGSDVLAEFAKRPQASDGQAVTGTSAFSSMAASVHDHDINRNFLISELEKMAKAIVQTQREIAGIKPKVHGSNRVASASEELAMVVNTTEEAATSILAIAERLQQIESELAASGANPALCSEIGAHATNLMIACSFQDVTGQRTQKAAKTLHFIEERINGLIEIWGVGDDEHPAAHESQVSDEAALLNGPAREGEGVTQEEIDKLIAF